jgi:hypothetical protein
MKIREFSVVLACGLLSAPAAVAQTDVFHLMQIEQVIGGVNGDFSAQAIQLRMREPFQNLITGTRLVAYDATGSNPVTLITFDRNVTNGQRGDRILVASPHFIVMRTDPEAQPDFVMERFIPPAYLDAGRVTFEDDFQIYWSLAWGGENYTGSNMGSPENAPGGNFGPPWPNPMPSDSLRALQFQGPANAMSSGNVNDYRITTGAARFVNNARQGFGVVSGQLSLDVSATCPGGGPIRIEWSGATPGGTAALIFALNQGSVVIPSPNPCVGTQLGLGSNQIQVGWQGPAGANGSRVLNATAPGGACGGFLQLLDVASCDRSNVEGVQ